MRKLNPEAKVITSLNSVVPLTEILNTKRFDFAKAERHKDWLSPQAHVSIRHLLFLLGRVFAKTSCFLWH